MAKNSRHHHAGHPTHEIHDKMSTGIAERWNPTKVDVPRIGAVSPTRPEGGTEMGKTAAVIPSAGKSNPEGKP